MVHKFLLLPQNTPRLCRGDECGKKEGGRGNGSFPVAESSESASVENGGVLKIKICSPNTMELCYGDKTSGFS